MTRVIAAVTLLSAILAFAAPSAAQPALDKRVSLDLKQMAHRDAFKVIADSIGYTAAVAPDVSTPVDIVIGNITARTALNTICESIGCAWRVSGTVIRVEKARSKMIAPVPGTRSTKARVAGVAEMRRLMDQVLPAGMKFDHAPLADVAARLSKATGLEITLRGALPDQTLSADFGGQPFSSALKVISGQLHGKVGIMTGRTGTGTPSMRILIIGAPNPRK